MQIMDFKEQDRILDELIEQNQRCCKKQNRTQEISGSEYHRNTGTLKVAATSAAADVAGALAGSLRTCNRVTLDVVGAGALNQAVKAIAIARGHLAPAGHDLVCTPSFCDLQIGGEAKTGLKLTVMQCKRF